MRKKVLGISDFERYVYERLAETIRELEARVAEDVYALAFWILNEDDDLRKPTLRLLANTRAQWRATAPPASLALPWPASSEQEAKWNHPFWIERPLVSIAVDFEPSWGEEPHGAVTEHTEAHDPAGIELRERWLAAQGLELEGKIGGRFAELCVRVARRLRHEGVIEAACGQDLPIIFFDREALSPEANALTNAANPPELIAEFNAFIDET